MLIDCALYVNGIRRNCDTLDEMYAAAKAEDGFVWVGIKDPEAAELAELTKVFELHELHIEDALKGKLRPKFDDFGAREFVTVKTLYYEEQTSQIETGDFMIYLGEKFVVTIRHGEGVALKSVRSELENHPNRIILGPYSVLQAVLDRIFDEYLAIAMELEIDIAALESKVFSDTQSRHSADLYFLKREVLEFRRAVDPLRAIFARLLLQPQIAQTDLKPFFQDMNDHLEIAIETGQSIDELVSTAIQADFAQLQVQQNNDMRKISAWVALAAMPTMLAGIYGMNFDNMPELHSTWGYPAVIGFMIASTTILYFKFKKSRWL